MTPELARVAIALLGRTQLQPNEIPAYQAVLEALQPLAESEDAPD